MQLDTCFFLTLKGIGGSSVFANTKTVLNIESNGTAFEILFYVVDLSKYKGIQVYTDSNGTRVYLKDDHTVSLPKVINTFSLSPEAVKRH